MKKQLKVSAVVVGAVVLSTLAINASDVVRGIDGSLTGLVIDGAEGPCGSDGTLLQLGDYAICVDTYEASAGETCPIREPNSGVETTENMQAGSCTTVSEEGNEPWRFVTLTQAQQLCARSGKRLPNNDEWYKAVVSQTNIDECVIHEGQGGPSRTGSANCTTPSGIHDMIGNVWEWIDAEIQDGQYANRTLPPSGYVALVDSDGIVIETSDEPVLEYGEDYAQTNDRGVRGIIRGGFYDSGTDAGLFALNAAVALNLQTAGIGFRCVKDI